MSEARGAADAEGAILAEASAAWVERGQAQPLGRWLERVLDPEGMPRRMPVPEWPACLITLAEARRRRARGWPDLFDARIQGFFLQVLRFSRPDGSMAFGPHSASTESRRCYRYWAEQLAEPGLSTVVDWWFPARTKAHAPPPLPATAQEAHPLAMLRPDWSRRGDFLAIDHRAPGASCALELFGLGRTWLGPVWTSEVEAPRVTHARPRRRITGASADLCEWSFRLDATRILRTVVLLRGRRLALLADQVDGSGPVAAMRVALPETMATTPLPECRGVRLLPSRSPLSAHVLPVGLPCRPSPDGRGTLAAEAHALVLSHPSERPRCWLPLLVSWEPMRHRKRVFWRSLTVSEKSRICGPDIACAIQVKWGKEESLVIYRSLARPACRAFLGHQTRARFLIGLFNQEGNVNPILQVDG